MTVVFVVFGLLIVITGLFLAVAMSIHFCACMKTCRRWQQEKARRREIREASAQGPPPYAIAVLSSRHRQVQRQCCQHSCHQSFSMEYNPPSGNAHACRTSSLPHEFPLVHNLLNTTRHSLQANSLTLEHPTSGSCGELAKNDSPPCVECVCDCDSPPSYEDALKIEDENRRLSQVVVSS